MNIGHRAKQWKYADIESAPPCEYPKVSDKHIGDTCYKDSPYVSRDDQIFYSEPRDKIYQSLSTYEAAKENKEGDRGQDDRRVPLDLGAQKPRKQQSYQKVRNCRQNSESRCICNALLQEVQLKLT